MEPVTVKSYEGFRATEYPKCFYVNRHKVEVMRIEKRWLAPGCRCFKVLGDDGRVYALEYNEKNDEWNLLTVNRLYDSR